MSGKTATCLSMTRDRLAQLLYRGASSSDDTAASRQHLEEDKALAVHFCRHCILAAHFGRLVRVAEKAVVVSRVSGLRIVSKVALVPPNRLVFL